MLHPEVLELIRQDYNNTPVQIDEVIMRMQEELAELIVAVSHLRKGRKTGISETIEECGDVLYMLDELMNKLHITSQVESFLVQKIIEKNSRKKDYD